MHSHNEQRRNFKLSVFYHRSDTNVIPSKKQFHSCSLFEMLPEIFKDTRETDVVLGPVITAGVDALKVSVICTIFDKFCVFIFNF